MPLLIEENTNSTNEFNAFNVETAERVADRNRRLLAEAATVGWVVIGVADSPKAARVWLQAYRAVQSASS